MPGVLIIGAGPAGMTAALWLESRGVPATVIEAEPEDRIRAGGRALFVHRDSLEILERASPGVGVEIAARGVVWQTKRTIYRGKEVFRRTYPPPLSSELPPFTSLRQTETEHHLREACRLAGAVIIWGARVSQVNSSASEVHVVTEDGRDWKAEYVIAADGARSATRGALGISLEGPKSHGVHIVVDLEEDPDDRMPVERVFHYRHPGLGARNVLLVPFAGGWQVDVQCRTARDAGELSRDDAVPCWLPRVIGHENCADRISWISTYRFLQVVAASFIDLHRRVLLVGEAAHLFAPFGARGMNSAIADAAAAAEAVATALDGGSPERARHTVEGFDLARRNAALRNRDAAGAALAHLRPRTPVGRARQHGAAVLARRVPRCGAWLDAAPYGSRPSPASDPAGRY